MVITLTIMRVSQLIRLLAPENLEEENIYFSGVDIVIIIY
jgi:hypothetical protein